jgi:hypothetical protein
LGELVMATFIRVENYLSGEICAFEVLQGTYQNIGYSNLI